MIKNLMHEFGHLLEEKFDKEFDDDFIIKCTEEFKEEYLTKERVRRETNK